MEDSVDGLTLSGLTFRVLELAGGSSLVRFLPPRVTGALLPSAASGVTGFLVVLCASQTWPC